MTTSARDLSGALVEVRKAYRLIHAYQRRLWDLLSAIDDTVSSSLEFKRWRPTHHWPPPKSQTRFFKERWAWDFLPAYDIGCRWEGVATDAGARMIFVIARADTGYQHDKGEQEGSFPAAEECATELHIGLWAASSTKQEWSKAVRELKSRRTEGETYTATIDDIEYRHRFLRVNVADLTDEGEVKRRVLRPIADWLAKPLPEAR